MPPTLARTTEPAPTVTRPAAMTGSQAHTPNPASEQAQVTPATIHPEAEGAPARVARLPGAGAIARMSGSDDPRASAIDGTSVAAKAVRVIGASATTLMPNTMIRASVPYVPRRLSRM